MSLFKLTIKGNAKFAMGPLHKVNPLTQLKTPLSSSYVIMPSYLNTSNLYKSSWYNNYYLY
jgi:hypothetical protein